MSTWWIKTKLNTELDEKGVFLGFNLSIYVKDFGVLQKRCLKRKTFLCVIVFTFLHFIVFWLANLDG